MPQPRPMPPCNLIAEDEKDALRAAYGRPIRQALQEALHNPVLQEAYPRAAAAVKDARAIATFGECPPPDLSIGFRPEGLESSLRATLELPEDVERRLRDQFREAVRRELETHRHVVRTELVQRGRPWQCVEHALPGELDARPGDKLQVAGNVWRVVDRLHRVDAMTLTLWVEPT